MWATSSPKLQFARHRPQLFIQLPTFSLLEVILRCCADSWDPITLGSVLALHMWKGLSCRSKLEFWTYTYTSFSTSCIYKASACWKAGTEDARGCIHSRKWWKLGTCCLQCSWKMKFEWNSIRMIAKPPIHYVLCDTRVLSPIPSQ